MSYISFSLFSVTLNKTNTQALLLLCTHGSRQLSTKKILNIQEMTFVCVLIRTEAKIFWYARSVVDKSIARAFRQAKSYSAFDQLLVRLPSSVVFERLFVLHSLF